MFGSSLSRSVFLARTCRLALFNLAADELHELYYDIGLLLILKEVLDRLCVPLNMYLVFVFIFVLVLVFVFSWKTLHS